VPLPLDVGRRYIGSMRGLEGVPTPPPRVGNFPYAADANMVHSGSNESASHVGDGRCGRSIWIADLINLL